MRKRKAEGSGPIHEAAKPGAETASSPLLGGPWEEEQGTRRPHPFHELALPKAEVCILNYGNCSGVGQTSGLPVHGASGSVNLGRSEHRARGPANRQTRGLPHPPT